MYRLKFGSLRGRQDWDVWESFISVMTLMSTFNANALHRGILHMHQEEVLTAADRC